MRRVSMVLLMLGFAAGRGWACSCLPMTVAQSLAISSDVFVGTVLSVRGDGAGSMKARIRIERSWKGTPAGHVVTVYTTFSEASCGVTLSVHREVILFAHHMTGGSHMGGLAVWTCSHNGNTPSTVIAFSDSLGTPVTVRSHRWWRL